MILLFRSSAGRGSEERRTTARDLIASSFRILSPSKRDPRYYKRSCFLSSEYVLETKHINRKTRFEHRIMGLQGKNKHGNTVFL